MHILVSRGDNELTNSGNHINGTESFWAFAKYRLAN